MAAGVAHNLDGAQRRRGFPHRRLQQGVDGITDPLVDLESQDPKNHHFISFRGDANIAGYLDYTPLGKCY
jgi:hypothetical protein